MSMTTFPIRANRRIFASRINMERCMHESRRLTWLIAIVGVALLSGWQFVIHARGHSCDRYDVRRDVGIDERGQLCRRR